MNVFSDRPTSRLIWSSRLIFTLTVFTLTIGDALTVNGGQRESVVDAKSSGRNCVYAKIILPMKAAAGGEHPLVESWIARQLHKRGVTELRAVTHWVRLAEPEENFAHLWNAVVDGEGWGCPVAGQVVKRDANGKLKVRLLGWSPVGAKVRGETLPAEVGSRRIATADTGDGKAYVALLVGPPSPTSGDSK